MASNENLNHNDRLSELRRSNYEIADGEPDILGWNVANAQGKKLGDVDELLFDEQARKVRYLVVDLHDNELNIQQDKKVLIPIGVAELRGAATRTGDDSNSSDSNSSDSTSMSGSPDPLDIINEDGADNFDNETDNSDGQDMVIVPVTTEQLEALPVYARNNVTPETESLIRQIFEGGASATSTYDKDGFYGHEHFNEEKFYNAASAEKVPVIKEDLTVGKREVETGGASITSRLVERPVQESINLKEEHVKVNVHTVNQPVSLSDMTAFKEGQIEMTEHAEVPVITKQARVIEEVSLNKTTEEKEEVIKETVRSTEVLSEKINPAQNTTQK